MARTTALQIVRAIIRFFFRSVEVVGLEHIPADRGGLLIAWHPNGLIDPALILTHFPHRVVFGARHGLLRWPLLGPLMRAIGTVPIYRAQDAAAGADADTRRKQNERSLDALAREIGDGSFAALFPEGVSHDDPHPTPLKSGAARLYYRACRLLPDGAPTPVVIPVGLHYDEKNVFRSRALVEYHPPLVLDGGLAPLRASDRDPDAESARRQTHALTERFDQTLDQIVHATADWKLHQLMHRAQKLLWAERARRSGVQPQTPNMEQRQHGFARVWAGYGLARERRPDATDSLLARVAGYDAALHSLGLDDHELDRDPQLPSRLLLLIAQLVGVYLLLPPLLLIGYLINGPAYWLIRLITIRAAKLRKDEASIKILSGLVLYPLSWAFGGALVAYGVWDYPALHLSMPQRPLWVAVFTALLGAFGGVVALYYTELAQQTWRAVRARIMRRTQRRSVSRLLDERAELAAAIEEMAASVDSTRETPRRAPRH